MRDIEGAGRRSLAIQADMSIESDANRAVNEAVAKLGPIWGLVVCAGIFEPGPVEEMSAEFWDRVMAINLRSTFWPCGPRLEHVARQHRDRHVHRRPARVEPLLRLCNIEGDADHLHGPMAKELAPRKIRVNCVCPAGPKPT